ncbi:MAG: ferredoxin [Pontiella sp.]|nr:ferredoxin [Pontiella sp.]MBT8045523.1 ferredoxin [Pontiella sp.]NNJ70875.1 ferredoxin [Kiritimatiellales bacterium]
MKFTVDQETCIGCGACEETCPEVFVVDDTSTVKLDDVPADLEASALEAEEGCPVDAISHT